MGGLFAGLRRPRDDQLRLILGGLGIALMGLALVLWLIPTGTAKTTVSETSTTTSTGTDAGEKAVVKTSTTTEPDDGPSDALLGVLFGTGAILFMAAASWDRIQEIGLPGGGSIKIAAAQVPTIGVEDIVVRDQFEAAGVGSLELARVSVSSSAHIVTRAKEIAESNRQVVDIDLGNGDKWLLPNLYFLCWVLERWTRVSLIVITTAEGSRTPIYVACTSPTQLRERIASAQPIVVAPTREAEENASLTTAGTVFFQALAQNMEAGAEESEPLPPPTWVTPEVLKEIAYPVLTFESVEIECEDELSKDEMRAILCFPRRFVPITKKEHFRKTVDRCRVAIELARPVVRAEAAAPD